MKKISKFLITTLLSCMILNQPLLCMMQVNQVDRDQSLGQLSKLSNDVLANICEYLEIKDLNKLSRTSKILNQLFDSYKNLDSYKDLLFKKTCKEIINALQKTKTDNHFLY